jgi:hypothetical protein
LNRAKNAWFKAGQNKRKNGYAGSTIARCAKGQCNRMVRLTWQLKDLLRLPMVVPTFTRYKNVFVKNAWFKAGQNKRKKWLCGFYDCTLREGSVQ